jgi:hypothetical protein
MTDRERTRLASAALSIARDIEAIVYHLRRVQHQLETTGKLLARVHQGGELDPTQATELVPETDQAETGEWPA